MKNLLILGDSFSYGEGCSDRTNPRIFHLQPASEYCWASLLKKDLPDVNIINLSIPGNSINGMFVDVVKFLEQNQVKIDYVLLSITSYNRIMVPFFNNSDRITNWVMGSLGEVPRDEVEPIDYHNAKQQFVKHLINDDIILYNGLLSLYGLISYCESLGSKVMWSGPRRIDMIGRLQLKNIDFDELDNKFFPHMWNYDYSLENNKKFNLSCSISDGHPNNIGHSLYHNQIIRPMIESFMKD